MSFDPGGGGIANANDVTLNNPATGDFLGYNTGVGKWKNLTLNGTAALATDGGVETLTFKNSQTGSVTLDVANGNVFSVGLAGNVTFVFASTTNNKACSMSVYLYAASGKTVTWPASVKWANGTPPSLTGSGSNPDILVFETLSGGTTWFGSLVGNNFS